MQVVSFLSVSPGFLTAASRPLSLFVPPVLPSPELIRKMDPEISFSAESTGHVWLHWGLGRPRRMNWCPCLEASRGSTEAQADAAAVAGGAR